MKIVKKILGCLLLSLPFLALLLLPLYTTAQWSDVLITLSVTAAVVGAIVFGMWLLSPS